MTAELEQLLTSLRYDTNLLKSASNTKLGPTNIANVCDADSGQSQTRSTPFYMLKYHYDRLITCAADLGWTEAAAIPALISTASFETALFSHLQSQIQANTSTTAAESQAIPSPQRIRVLLDKIGTLTIQAFPTAPVPLSTLFPETLPEPLQAPVEHGQPLRIYLDSKPTIYPPVDALSGSRVGKAAPKTTARDHYNSPRTRFSLAPTDVENDVLLYVSHSPSDEQSDQDQDGIVTETTISTILFWRLRPQTSDKRSSGRWMTPDIRAHGGIEGVVRRWLLENNLCEIGSLCVRDVVDGEVVLVCNGVRGVRRGVIVRKR